MVVQWQLGCNELSGDTAKDWLKCMLCHFLILPFYAIFKSGVKTGLFLHACGFNKLDLEYNSVVKMTAAFGLSILWMPLQAVILVVLLPLLIITRLYQMIKMFMTNIAGTCCLGCCKCCCF